MNNNEEEKLEDMSNVSMENNVNYFIPGFEEKKNTKNTKKKSAFYTER